MWQIAYILLLICWLIAILLSLSRFIKPLSVIQIWMNYQFGQIPDEIDRFCYTVKVSQMFWKLFVNAVKVYLILEA